MREHWEEYAKNDSGYAIAVALLSVASALRDLGTGNAASPMGAVEFLAVRIGEKIEEMSTAISEAGSRVADAIDKIPGGSEEGLVSAISESSEQLRDAIETIPTVMGNVAARSPGSGRGPITAADWEKDR